MEEWRTLYRAAIVCGADSSEMAKRFSDAEEAIVEQMREIFRETRADADGDRRRSS